MGNIHASALPVKVGAFTQPSTKYAIEITLRDISIYRRQKVVQVLVSPRWLQTLMTDADKDTIDILIGNSNISQVIPEVSDISYKLHRKDAQTIKIVVSWRSIPVKLDNLALAIGVHFNDMCGHQKIDLLAWPNDSPALNAPDSYSLSSAL